MSLEAKLLNKRLDIINESINLNMTSLYTWALYLKKSIEDKHLHLSNSSQNLRELELANSVIDVFINRRNDPVATSAPTPVKPIQVKPAAKPRQAKTLTERIAEQQDLSAEMKTIVDANAVEPMADLARQEHDQMLLEKNINEKRQMMLKEQQDLMNSMASTPPKVVFSTSIDADDQPSHAPEPAPAPNAQVYYPPKKRPTVEEIEANAPEINPMLRYSPADQQRIQYDMFLQAKKNVNSMQHGLTDPKAIEALVFREANQLFADFMKG